MNQEIQLSVNPNLPVAANKVGTSLVYTGPQQPTAMQIIHRLLRGRYGVAVVLGLIFAVAGAAAGYLLMRQSLQSVALIDVKPYITTPDSWDHVMPMYTLYVSSMVQKIKSESVIRGAMQDERVAKMRPNNNATIAEINKGLNAKYLANTSLVQVTFDSDQKDAREFAPAVLQAIVHQYENRLRDLGEATFADKVNAHQRQIAGYEQQLTTFQHQIDEMTKDIGENPQLVIESQLHEKANIEKNWFESNNTLEAAAQQLKNIQGDYTVEDWARVDPRAKAELEAWVAAQSAADLLRDTKYLPNHPAFIQAKDLADAKKRELENYTKLLNTTMFIREKPDGSGGVPTKRNLADLRAIADANRNTLDKLEKSIQNLQLTSTKVAELRGKMRKVEEELAKTKKHMEEQELVHQMDNTVTVIDYGTAANAASDKRIALSAVGFVAGGSLPIALMLLAGLLNPRVRFSDETSHETNGLTLLGILPDLPDRLSDPEQASIAAHCVHQIRTMLQINNHTHDRRVFAVTSAAPGDGKTSLTLAMGLSYAACGTRTLLIDCDIVGAGLTTRMNVNVPEGVLEAIANRTLLEYVRTTDVADVAILPVGTAQGMHASTLSPPALRRLVDEARKHFDTVLIDTGPILGSIEASLVCAAADAVVLTVARGQQRPLVEKAISHLASIGARLAGVVFNRAQASDFERSISGMSVRANPNSSGRIGPVARAVQTSVKGRRD